MIKRLRQFRRKSPHLKDHFWNLSSQILSSAASIAAAVIITRDSGIELFGRFSLCFLILMLNRNFLMAMLLTPMSSIGPKIRKATLPYKGFLLLNLIGFLGLLCCVLAIVAALGGYAGADWLGHAYVPLVVAAVLGSVSDYLRRFQILYGTPARAFAIDLCRYTAQTFVILAASLSAGGIALSTALFAIAVGGALGASIGAYWHGGWQLRWHLNRAAWRRHLNFIRWTTPGVALESLQGAAPLFLVAAVLGEAAVGVIRAMQVVANAMNLPLNALQQIAPVLAGKAFAAGGLPRLRLLMVETGIGALLFSLAIVAAVLTMGHFVIDLGFEIDHAQAQGVLLAFVVANMLALGKFIISLELQAREITWPIAVAATLGAAIAVFGTVPLAMLVGLFVIPLVAAILNSGAIAIFIVAAHRRNAPSSKQKVLSI